MPCVAFPTAFYVSFFALVLFLKYNAACPLAAGMGDRAFPFREAAALGCAGLPAGSVALLDPWNFFSSFIHVSFKNNNKSSTDT